MLKILNMRWKGFAGLISAAVFVAILGVSVSAEQMESTNFQLNGNINSAFGGQGSSASYGMFSTGGEPVIGRGASGSYILGGGYTAQLEHSIQLTVQPSGLLGYWDFDESTGSLYADGSALGADATKGGQNDGDITTIAGKIGNGLDGSAVNGDSRIEIPSAGIQPSSVTLETWVRVDDFPDGTWESVCSYYAIGGEDWGPFELYTDGNNSNGSYVNFLWTIQNGAPQSISTTPGNFALNTWHHVVGTYDAATGISKLYVNGVEQVTAAYSPASLNYTVANTDDKISCFNTPRWPGEGIDGGIDQLKIFDRALDADEIMAEYTAQNNNATATGLTLYTVTPGASNTALKDVIVRTDAAAYGIAISQNHNLQKGAATIPGVSASIASPAAWVEGTTKGLGFTLLNAPGLDSKWGSGANYASIPGSATSFYTRSGHDNSDTIDVINSRLRLDAAVSQESGDYSNTVTYTGTVLP